MSLERLQEKLEHVYQRANRHSGGTLDIIRLALLQFNALRGAEAAASIAYYAIFSLFPLLLLLVSIIGFLLVNFEAPGEVLDVIDLIAPVSREFIQENLAEILERRGTGGIIGLIGLAWAASGVFLGLARNINRAWPTASLRNVVQGRLVALGIVGLLALMLFLFIVVGIILDIITRLEEPFAEAGIITDGMLINVLSTLIPWFFAFLLFLILYRYVPNIRVKWIEAFWGAVIAAIGWGIATLGFTWYLSSGFAQFELFYGSLGTTVAILLWIYLTALITLFGAHISAAIAHVTRFKDHEHLLTGSNLQTEVAPVSQVQTD